MSFWTSHYRSGSLSVVMVHIANGLLVCAGVIRMTQCEKEYGLYAVDKKRKQELWLQIG